jgi:hypothetical protein
MKATVRRAAKQTAHAYSDALVSQANGQAVQDVHMTLCVHHTGDCIDGHRLARVIRCCYYDSILLMVLLLMVWYCSPVLPAPPLLLLPLLKLLLLVLAQYTVNDATASVAAADVRSHTRTIWQ